MQETVPGVSIMTAIETGGRKKEKGQRRGRFLPKIPAAACLE
jgi:hypothetical protein